MENFIVKIIPYSNFKYYVQNALRAFKMQIFKIVNIILFLIVECHISLIEQILTV